MKQADQRIAPLSLRRNVLWVLSGRGIYAACQWGLIAVCAKFGSADLLGRYALGVAICTPIFMLANLKLAEVLVTDASDEHGFTDYTQLRFMTAAAAMLVIAMVVLVADYEPTTVRTVLAVGLGQAILSCREIYLARAQKAQRMDRPACSNAFLGVTGLTVFALTFWIWGSLVAAILSLAATRLAVTVTVDAPGARRIESIAGPTQRPARSRARELVRLAYLSVPLGIVSMLASYAGTLPRYEVERQLGEAPLGYFAALASLPTIGIMLVDALAKAASPRLAHYYIDNRRAFAALARKLVVVGVLLSALAMGLFYLFGKPILTICFSADYANYHRTLMWLMTGGALMYLWSIMETCLTAARFFRIQVPIYVCAAGTALVSAWILIPSYRLDGAAFALIGANTVGLVGTACAVVYATLRAKPKVLNSTAGATDN